MAKFSQITAKTRRAPRTVTIHPDEFASTWDRIPEAPIVVGVRRLSDSDETIAIAGAEKTAKDLYNVEGSEAYEQIHAAAMLRHIVCQAICDPNDVMKPHRSFPVGEPNIRRAINPVALRRLFDEIERVTIEASPLYPEATDAEIGDVAGRLLAGEQLAALPAVKRDRVRRYLRFVLDELRGDADELEEIDLSFLEH